MSTSPSLSSDILLVILELLPRQSDVASMSRASKALRVSSIRHLLRYGITISTEQGLASFVSFLHSDLSNRAPQVRKLYVKINMGPDEDFGSDFEDIEYDMGGREETKAALRLLCNTSGKLTELEDLSIDSCEEILKLERGMLGAIVALEKLRRLQVSSVGELTATLFEKIKSSLVEVDLHCFSDGMDEPEDLVPIVVRFMEPSRGSAHPTSRSRTPKPSFSFSAP